MLIKSEGITKKFTNIKDTKRGAYGEVSLPVQTAVKRLPWHNGKYTYTRYLKWQHLFFI
jgi:hypothetical protein